MRCQVTVTRIITKSGNNILLTYVKGVFRRASKDQTRQMLLGKTPGNTSSSLISDKRVVIISFGIWSLKNSLNINKDTFFELFNYPLDADKVCTYE